MNMDNSLFFIFPPILEKFVKWGSGSFEFYFIFFKNAIWSGAIQGMLLSNTRWKDLIDALRGLIEAKHFKKHPFQTNASGIVLVESIEGWSKKQDKTSKQTSDQKTKINQSGRSKRSLHESQGEHEARVTSYVYEIRSKITGPFDGC